jgi:hypothetical protein
VFVKLLGELEDNDHQFVWTIEAHLAGQLSGWRDVLELLRLARSTWAEAVA